VGVAKILLEYGAGINTHSNEFKESALTLACYKGEKGGRYGSGLAIIELPMFLGASHFRILHLMESNAESGQKWHFI
jgi:hypothetical protein